MGDVYATAVELEDWIGREVAGADRKLRNASILLREKCARSLDLTLLDTDETTALQEAACAQVEFWELVGAEHETGGVRGRLKIADGEADAPTRLARRARSILLDAGLLYLGAKGARSA